MDKMQASAGRHARIMLWSLAVILAGILLLPFGGYLYVAIDTATAVTAQTQTQSQQNPNPRSNYWRAVREGQSGYTATSGPYTTDNLVLSQGETWRQLRNGYVTLAVTIVLGTALALIVLFHFIKGPSRLEQPLSGRLLPRWSGGERLLHWYTATLFIVLSITGFSLLFGRAVLIPWLGLEGFSAYANVAKPVHDYAGPLFLVGVIFEVITWMRLSFFKAHDLVWLKSLGGIMKTGVHPPAGRTNAGEKIWFWIIATLGLFGVGISGLILDFPNFGQSRETMQLANLIHAVLAALWLAVAFGHIYLGTLGTPGTLRGMVTGRISAEWMQQHHNLWYEQLQQGGDTESAQARPRQSQQPGPAPLR